MTLQPQPLITSDHLKLLVDAQTQRLELVSSLELRVSVDAESLQLTSAGSGGHSILHAAAALHADHMIELAEQEWEARFAAHVS